MTLAYGRGKAFLFPLVFTLIMVGLYFTSLHNYLLFHSLSEMFSIVIAFSVFTIVCNSTRYTENAYLTIVGVSCLFVGFLDLLHALAFKGMSIFTNYDYATQLWVAARFMESTTLLAAFAYVNRKKKPDALTLIAGYSIVTAIFVVTIFWWKIFPVCFVEGKGLTPFKIYSEYVICAILGFALYMLYRERDYFGRYLFNLLALAVVCTIISELAFTFYVSTHGLSNLVGHYFKIFSFLLVYVALIKTNVRDPYNLIFRELNEANLLLAKEIAARKMGEETLKESERLFRDIADVSGDWIWEVGPDGNYTFASDKIKDVLGYEPSEVRGRSPFDLMPPDEAARVRLEFQAMLDQRRPFRDLENINVCKNGELRTVLTSGVPIFDAQGVYRGYRGIDKDVTSAKLAENELKRSEERFRKVFDHAATGIAITDCAGRFVQCNAAYSEITGYSEAELLARDFPEMIHPDDRLSNMDFIRRLLIGQMKSFEIENRYIRKDGSFVWVHKHISLLCDDCAQPTHLIALVTDMTQAKQADDLLRFLGRCGVGGSGEGFFPELARYLAEVLNLDFVCIDRLEEDRLSARTLAVFHNGRFEDNVSYTLKDTPCGDVVGKTICCFPRNVRGLFPNDSVLEDLGAESYLGVTLWSAQGVPIGLIAVIGRQPLTDTRAAESILQMVAVRASGELERQMAEESLREAMLAADAANRAKSDFLARMSHELRTPMNGISGMIELALRQGLSGKPREYLSLAKQSAASLLEIINDILDLARIESGRMKLAAAAFSPRQTVRAIVSFLGVAADEKGVELLTRIDGELPELVEGDETRLRQILLNLVGNAVKFTHEGAVTVAVERAREEVGSGKVTLLFRVSDTGIGIHQDHIDAIFDNFSQATADTHAKYGGTGLGLSISKHLVALMGGEITVESQPGVGSTFTVRIAFSEPGSALDDTRQKEGRQPEARTGGLRILLAEDNHVNRLYAQAILEEGGHSVTLAEDGPATLDALRKERFDLVLMDVQMPYLDGMEVTRLIREGGAAPCPRDIPVIALTAHAITGDRERFIEAGMDDYVSKPLDLGELDRVLSRWRPGSEATLAATNAAETETLGEQEQLRRRVAELLSRLPPEKVWSIVGQCAERLKPSVLKIVSLIAQGDGAGVSMEAHSLRGICMVVLGTERMIELTRELEYRADHGDLGNTETLIDAILGEVEILQGFVDGLRETGQMPTAGSAGPKNT